MNKLVFCLLILSVASTTYAEVTERLDYIDYPATVDAQLPLNVTLNNASPIRENGNVFHGYTKWWVQWHFWWQKTANGECTMSRVKVDLSSTITLPKLAGTPSRVQQSEFDQYAAALKTHELGHYNNGKQAANAVEQAILHLPSMPSCEQLESQANKTGLQILKEYNQKDRQYDAATSHGKTQGARLN
ncbi:DUF922 domain-containing Zn-dependent protease [Undibacterium sp. Xuan67W]|uniref:DUF922 domain-containing Zn-dependent protease n=1 Tax=Undibacterium sp. Xuan67W TaxID=3413057 RepID=UPI003BF124C5